MTEKLTLSSPSDVLRYIPTTMGFHPEESLVILGLGPSTPTARIDLPTDDADMAAATEGLAPALVHWDRVIVVIYSADAAAVAYVYNRLEDLIPGTTRVTVLHADGNIGWILDRPDLAPFVVDPTVPLPVGDLPARKVSDSRADMAAEAADVADGYTAFKMAVAAYEGGNGARAWVYLDRSVELLGRNAATEALAGLLENAVNPAKTTTV